VLANLALEEGDERLPQTLKLWIRSEIHTLEFSLSREDPDRKVLIWLRCSQDQSSTEFSNAPAPKRTVKSRAIQFLRPTLDFAQSEQIYSVIELSPQKLQELCAILDKFALPRAIADFEHHSFVAWNTRFIEQTGFSEHQLRSSKPDELLTFGESWLPLPSEGKEQSVQYVACAAKLPSGRDPALGYAVRTGGKLCYVMLDVFDSSSAQFEQGRTAGREEERNRVMKEFHDEVSSSLIAALFLIQTAKIELEDASLPQAQAVSNASDILTDATEKIMDVLTATREQST